MFELLAGQGSVKKALRKLFDAVIEQAVSGEERRGCFMGNAMSELAGRCPKTAEKACNNMTAVEETFYRALLRGKQAGEIRGVRDLRSVARFLYSSLQGLLLIAKTTQDREKLEDVIKVTLSVLG